MRRLARPVLTAALGLAALSACAGGTGLSTGSSSSTQVSQVYFTSNGSQVNDFFVSPLITTPVSPLQALAVTAIAQTGSGVSVGVLPNATFTWAARFVTASDPTNLTQYLVGPTPSGFKTCSFPASTPAVPIYYQAAGGVLAPLGSTQQTQQVFIAPVAGVPAPYCLVLQATSSPGNVIGAITVVVSNSP